MSRAVGSPEYIATPIRKSLSRKPGLWLAGGFAVGVSLIPLGGPLRAWWKLYDRVLPVRILEAGVTPPRLQPGEEGALIWDAPGADRVEALGPEGPLFLSDRQAGVHRFRAGREGTLLLTAYRLRRVGDRWARECIQRRTLQLHVTAPEPSPTLSREPVRSGPSVPVVHLVKQPAPALRTRDHLSTVRGSPAEPRREQPKAESPVRRPPVGARRQEASSESLHRPRPSTLAPESARPVSPLADAHGDRDVAHVSIEREAAPLMLHVLSVYWRLRHRSGEGTLLSLRDRGWSFEELALLCVAVERTGRALEEVARAYERRRNWKEIARELNITLAPGDARGLLRLAVERYCVLGAGTARDLEERGWSLGDVLVAGNLFFLSESGFWEIVQRRGAGSEWSTLAREIGVSPARMFRPTPRRLLVAGASR